MAAARELTPIDAVRTRRPAGQTPWQRALVFLPLLGAILVAVHAAAAALTLTTDEPAFEAVLHFALTVGVIASFVAIATGRSFTYIGGIVMAYTFVAYALRSEGVLPLAALLFPPEVQVGDELGLSALVAWWLVGFAFMQSQRENLVFVFVPGLTVFGLMATRNLNAELLIAFMVFLLASVYCWGYEHFLREVHTDRQPIDWRRWGRAHLSRAALLFAIAGVGGALVGNALYYTTPRLWGFGFQPRVWNWVGAHVPGYFLFRDGFEIGTGPIHLSPNPVLKVRAASGGLWGGRVYDRYSGQGWSRTYKAVRRVQRVGERTFDVRRLEPVPRPDPTREAWLQWSQPPPPPAGIQPPPPVPPGLRPTRPAGAAPARPRSPQGSPPPPSAPGTPRAGSDPQPSPADWLFKPLRGRAMSVEFEVMGAATAAVFAAPHPTHVAFGPRVGFIDPARRSGLSTDIYGALQTGTVMERGQSYTVSSTLPQFEPAELRAASPGSYSAEFRQQYIEQRTLEAEVALGTLVNEITRAARTDYDRARAIQSYLEEKCLYTLDVPRTPVGEDAVVYFVRTSRRGACDLFASAMSVMCRLAGVPARVATGFSTGTYSPGDQAFIVRGTDAHAWSEVYFSGYGWVPFDLSAVQQLDGQSLVSLLRSGHWRLVTGSAGRLALWGLILLGGLYLASTALVDLGPAMRVWGRRWRGRCHPVELLGAEFEGLLRLVARRAKLRFRPAHTPWTLVGHAADSACFDRHPHLLAALRDVTGAFYEVRYGRTPPPERVSAVRREIARVRRDLRRLRQDATTATP